MINHTDMLHYRLTKNQVYGIVKTAQEIDLLPESIILMTIYHSHKSINVYYNWDYSIASKATLANRLKRLSRIGLITHIGRKYYANPSQKRNIMSLFSFLLGVHLDSMR